MTNTAIAPTETPLAPQWAVIELMGHIRYGGQVSKDTQLGTAMLRVDVPQGEGMITQLINPSSIYRLTMCSEEIARAAAKAGDPKPMGTWELPRLSVSDPDPDQDDDTFDNASMEAREKQS